MQSLDPRLQAALAAMGIEKPTEIQLGVMEPALKGEDFVARAPTGTGKTAAFLVPIIERMLASETLKAVVIEPSRELVIQAANECRKIAPKEILVAAAYGGTSPLRQKELLKRGARIVIGTPGRLHELLQEGVLKPSEYGILVLDEADRLMQGEFGASTLHIASRLPKTRQTMLFSVQMPAALLAKASQLLKPGFLQIVKGKVAGETVSHFYVVAAKKAAALVAMLREEPVKSMVFCSSSQGADQARRELNYAGLGCICLHSQLDSARRHSAIKKFASGAEKVLVATDLAARGLHLKGVKRVYSYELPTKPEFYLHRAGRTGRMGERGECVSIVLPVELKKLKQTLNYCGAQAQEIAVKK